MGNFKSIIGSSLLVRDTLRYAILYGHPPNLLTCACVACYKGTNIL